MNEELLNQIERQVAALRPDGAPSELRSVVLNGVRRELRAGRLDRRLARAAVVLLVVGVGLNIASGMRATVSRDGFRPLVRTSTQQSLVDTAVVVAEATDATTGRQLARQLAAMSGRELTADEAAAIDAAVRRVATNGDRG